MNWLHGAIKDNTTGGYSSKRIAMLMATFALAVSTILLSIAAMYGRDVAMALGAVSVPLAGLGGYSYVGGKTAEAKKDAQ